MTGAEREGYRQDGESGMPAGEPAPPAEESVTSAGEDQPPGPTRARRPGFSRSNQGVAMFRRPKRPRFRRSSDALVEPKQRERLKAAAIAAEYATGRTEENEEAANRSVVIRLGRITLGTLVILAGVVMLVVPGPGWLGIAAGLAILSKDVAWADRALHFIREKIPGVPADGSIPRSTWLVMGLLTASGIALGIYIQTGA